MTNTAIYLGHIVKSNSHCDYIAQLVDQFDVATPPQPEDYGFGRFVQLADEQRHWAVGVIYNSQLLNPQFNQLSPRLTTTADTFLSPDLVSETRTLLWIALIGHLEQAQGHAYGQQGIPTLVVPVNTPVWQLTPKEIATFHRSHNGHAQFRYYAHLLRSTGNYAAPLLAHILETITPLFEGKERRSLEILSKELAWRHTLGSLR
ncbi:hypothetical protein L5470_03875 [Synechococcus sp. PCC 6717]|jgi:hypothetical protein|nr:hypothetical protein [Synechococcus sp. PCC 6717]